MNVTYDMVNTLRADMKHHEPIVLISREVIGVDLYNQATTGGVSKTLNSVRSDSDHVPCVLIYDARGNWGGYDMPDNHGRPPKPDNRLYGCGGGGQE